MRKTKFILTLLCVWLGWISVSAQSVQIIKELEQNPFASAVVLYKNDFGSFEKPDLIDTFPYAVIRMHLEGSAQAVREAKARLTLDVGQMFRVESRVTTYTNQIVFLVKAKRLYMLIDCGDGCEKVLLNNMEQLRSNCVYDCTVRFVPENESVAMDSVDLAKMEQEIYARVLASLKDEQKVDTLSSPKDTVSVAQDTLSQPDQSLSKYAQYAQNAKMKTLIMGQIGYSVSPQLSFGAMVGQMYRGYGWYVSGRSNFHFAEKGTASCDADGLADGVKPFYSGNTSSSHLAIHGGFMMNVLEQVTKNKFTTLGVYVGGGYGKRELLAETTDGEWIKYAPTSHNGFAGNVGLFGSIAGVTLNVGVSTINFKYVDLEVGVGFMF